MSQQINPPENAPQARGTPLRMFFTAYRVEVTLFLVSFFVLAMFSGHRFWRQSAAPHFVYQAKAMLEGRSDIDPQVLPNIEDWACVREVNGAKQRCEGTPQPGDRWYSSFPWFPAVVMAPFVLVQGYQLNDTSFGVIVGALAIALFYSLLRTLRQREGGAVAVMEDALTALTLGFGTLFFYASIRGEVWFSAEVMGVAFTALYLRNAIGAKRPVLAGLFWSMAVLTRTPLFFTGLFFLLEVLMPQKAARLEQLKTFTADKRRQLGQFVLAAAPLGVLAMVWNVVRFGSPAEFGHRFFFNNRVNADIDAHGLFSPVYLLKDLDAAFLKLPFLSGQQLSYDPWGMSLFITLPLLALAFVPAKEQRRALWLLAAMAGVLIGSAMFPEIAPPRTEPAGYRSIALWLLLATVGAFFVAAAVLWVRDAETPRLVLPVMLTLWVTMLPGLVYQNTGYAQFGFRFSIDYTPYLLLLFALGGWSWKKPLPLVLGLLGLAVNFAGAVGFRGYTELVRQRDAIPHEAPEQILLVSSPLLLRGALALAKWVAQRRMKTA